MPTLAETIAADEVLSALAHVADDAGIASALNAAGYGTVTMTTMPKWAFIKHFTAPVSFAVLSASNELKAKWQAILGAFLPNLTAWPSDSPISLGDPTVAGLIALAVSDGLLTQAAVDAATRYQGSRAEVLWGAGRRVEIDEIRGVR
jgi:hypothetical protein